MALTTAQQDLFLTPIADAGLRDLTDLMSVPILSLSKQKRVTPILFARGDTTVEVSAPAHIGLATVWDWEFVLFAVSQINEAINRGDTPSPTIRAAAYDMLRGVKRGVSGREYLGLKEALDRLKATTIRTTINAKNVKRGATFSYLDSVRWIEDPTGRLQAVEVTISDWMFQAILDHRVLSVDDRWFNITGGIERRLYQIVRKQAGDRRDGWRWSLAELHERSGVTGPLKNFSVKIRQIVRAGTMPEYFLQLYRDGTGQEALHAVRRSKLSLDHPGRELALPRNPRNPDLGPV